MKIGFIGLGVMGFPMACNLIKNGLEVYGFDLNENQRKQLEALGGNAVDEIKQIAVHCEAVVIMLPATPHVMSVIFENSGLLSRTSAVKYILDCSTIDVKTAEEIGQQLKESGIAYMDSPVSGGPQGAVDGTLTIMVGGEETAYREVKYIYEAMGKNINYIGGSGAGQKAKLINQLMTWVNHAVICEAAVLAKKAGMDMDMLYKCLLTSYGYSKILEVCWQPHIQPENYENPTGMAMMVKDLKLLLDFSRAYDTTLPMTNTAMTMYNRAIEMGYKEKDPAVIMEQLKEM